MFFWDKLLLHDSKRFYECDCKLTKIICKDGEGPVIAKEDLNKSPIKTNEEIITNEENENVICSCPFCCCCVCSCIKSISK